MRISDWSSDVCSSDLFLVENRVEPVDLLLVAPERVAFMGGISTKMVTLAEHRAYPAHLEHQPLEDARLQQRIIRPSGALVIFCEINEDCNGVELRQRSISTPILVAESRHIVFRVERHALLTQLLIPRHVAR